MKNFNLNQYGMVPVIYIIAVIVVLGAFAALFFQLSNKGANKKPSPPPNTASLKIPAQDKDCADRDYTGCDGVEVVKWTDDGKR